MLMGTRIPGAASAYPGRVVVSELLGSLLLLVGELQQPGDGVPVACRRSYLKVFLPERVGELGVAYSVRVPLKDLAAVDPEPVGLEGRRPELPERCRVGRR